MRKLLVVALFAPSVAFAATGSIDVQVSNAPGEIVLDGFPTDKRAPALLEQVPIGSHVVELEYGCMVGKAEVNVSEGAKAVVKLPLSNRGGEGTLRLRGTPFNAEVMVDGAPISKAEEGVKLPCGARRIEVSAPGFSSWSEVVVITTGKWTTIEPKLAEDMEDAPSPSTVRPPPKPDPAVSALDEEEEEDVRPPSTRPPVRSEFEELEDELEDEQDPDAMDEDEMLEQESDEVLDEIGGGRRDEEEEEDVRPRPIDEEEEEIRPRPIDEEEEEEEIRRPPKDKKPFPARGVLTVGLGAVGVGGIAAGAALTPTYLDNKAAYDLVVQVNGPTSPQAIELANGPVAQSKANMMTGYVLGGIGVAGATAAFLLIPGMDEKDAEDLVFSPTPTGFVVSGRF